MKTAIAIALALTVLLSGCHGKVLQVASTARQTVQVKESCRHYDYCHECKTVSVMRNGKSSSERKCGYGYHYDCPGKRLVLAETWTETRRYEDGHVGQYPQRKKLKNLSECNS